MIYVLIAGSYTPFALVSLRNGLGLDGIFTVLAAGGCRNRTRTHHRTEKRKTSAVYCDLYRNGLDGLGGNEIPDSLTPVSRTGLAGGRRYAVQRRHLLVCKR